MPAPNDNKRLIDINIDDFIGIAPDVADTVLRVSQAIILSIHSSARLVDTLDPIP